MNEIKKDFPLLENREIAYLDSGATAQKPRQVIKAVEEFYEKNNANPHRGAYTLSTEATEEYENKHEWKYTVLNKPENMKRLVTDLEKFGINCSSMETIQEGLSNLLDVEVTLVIKTSEPKEEGKEGYRNISVNPLEK